MKNDYEESIGQRLKRLRRSMVLSQAELSNISGVPLPTIKDIERGVTAIPRGKTIRALAKALGVTASYLLNGDSSLDNKY